jgi:cellulose biosynthesis protein BcsQ
MKVISIVSMAGGVGRTGLAVSLSNESGRDRKTLSVDLDLRGNLTDFYLRGKNPNKGFLDFFRGEIKLESLFHETRFNTVIPSALISLSTGDPSISERILELIRTSNFDSVFIDCSPLPSYDAKVAIVSSDIVLIPITNDRRSFRSVPLILNEIKTLMSQRLFTGKILGVPSLVDVSGSNEILNSNLPLDILKTPFIESPAIDQSLHDGTRLEIGTFEQEMVKSILGELL